jgi:hypothetical protein
MFAYRSCASPTLLISPHNASGSSKTRIQTEGRATKRSQSKIPLSLADVISRHAELVNAQQASAERRRGMTSRERLPCPDR